MSDTFDDFQTLSMLRSLLGAQEAHPKKRFGQNFLIDRNLMMQLVEAAEIDASDVMLEVGTGTGSLTGLMARRAAHVHTFEIDPHMVAIATRALSQFGNVTLHHTDALESQTQLAVPLQALVANQAAPLKLAANLPYDAATPLLMGLLRSPQPPMRFVFTIQREVGQRLTAAANTRDFGPASIIAQATCRVERLALLPPSAFWPPPKVDSVLMQMVPHDNAYAPHDQRLRLADLARAAFLHRRKQVAGTLADIVGRDVRPLLAECGIEANARPEAITVPQWIELSQRIHSTRPADGA